MKMFILTMIEVFAVHGILNLNVSKDVMFCIFMVLFVVTDVSATLIERYKVKPNERK